VGQFLGVGTILVGNYFWVGTILVDQSFWGGHKFSVLYFFLETFLVDHFLAHLAIGQVSFCHG
jgi:hypothetical protein